jgi:hypothetical protein
MHDINGHHANQIPRQPKCAMLPMQHHSHTTGHADTLTNPP